MKTFGNVSINTATCGFKFPLTDIIYACAKLGIGAISPWAKEIDGNTELKAVKKALDETGVKLSGFCRSEYYTYPNSDDRKSSIEKNKHLVDMAAFLGAPCVVQVVGGLYPENHSLNVAYDLALSGLEKILDYASSTDVKIAIEPLHPMQTADRSCLNKLEQAIDWCEELDPHDKYKMGIALDSYHTWWDCSLYSQIKRAGSRILSVHVSDFLLDTQDLVNDRGLPGSGVIDLNKFVKASEDAGYEGFIEIEIFSNRTFKKDASLHDILRLSAQSVVDSCNRF